MLAQRVCLRPALCCEVGILKVPGLFGGAGFGRVWGFRRVLGFWRLGFWGLGLGQGDKVAIRSRGLGFFASGEGCVALDAFAENVGGLMGREAGRLWHKWHPLSQSHGSGGHQAGGHPKKGKRFALLRVPAAISLWASCSKPFADSCAAQHKQALQRPQADCWFHSCCGTMPFDARPLVMRRAPPKTCLVIVMVLPACKWSCGRRALAGSNGETLGLESQPGVACAPRCMQLLSAWPARCLHLPV